MRKVKVIMRNLLMSKMLILFVAVAEFDNEWLLAT